MALTHKTTHVEEAKDQLAQQFHGKAKLEALLGALIQQAQDAEDAAFSIHDGFNLDTAVGAQLDGLGGIVGEPRNGREDETYRLWIRARILLNRSSGKVGEIYDIFNLIIPAGTEPELTDYYPAAFVLSITGGALEPDLADQLSLILHQAKAAGVGASLTWQESADADTFQFSSTEPGFATLAGSYLAGATELEVLYGGGEFPPTNFIEVSGTETMEYNFFENPTFALVDPMTLDHAEGDLVLLVVLTMETSTTQGFADVSTGGGGMLAGATEAGELVEREDVVDTASWLATLEPARRRPPDGGASGGGGGFFGPPL